MLTQYAIMMFAPSEDQQPLAYFRGYPLYATHVVMIFFAATMLICTVIGNEALIAVEGALGFSSELVYHGQVWRIFTYGLINPPTLGFAFSMVVLVWFGRDVEQFLGRRIFLTFYGVLYLLIPLTFTALGFWRKFALAGQPGTFGIFIAFATLYPGALLFFRIQAMWWAIGGVVIGTLISFYNRDFIGLIAFLLPVAFAHFFVRYEQGRLTLPQIPMPSLRRKPKLRVLPNPNLDSDEDPDEPMAEVDALLDKIAKSGLASLTEQERKRLEKAREDLMKRESPRR